MTKISAAVVGLGKIGQGLDEDMNPHAYCLTHSQAFAHHPSFNLVGGVDSDAQARGRFSLRFKVGAYSSVGDLARAAKPDVWVVAGPTKLNFEIFKEVLNFGPKIILIEKPLGENIDQAREMMAMSKAAKIELAVNFMRRAEPGVLQVKQILESGNLGSIDKAVVTYSKGLLNNGSHFIDLMRYWLGPSSHHEVMGATSENFEGDPEPDFCIRFGKTPVYFLSAREKNYSVRDIELIGSRGGLRYLRGGQKIYVHDVVESQVFKGYRFQSLDGKEIAGSLDRAQYFVADHLAQHILKGTPLVLPAIEALKTMEDVERIKSLCRAH